MSEHNITVESGSTVRLKTAGKYCDRDILVSGGAEDLESALDAQKTLIATLQDALKNKAGVQPRSKTYEITLAQASGWVLLTKLDDDVLEHISDTNLVVSLKKIGEYAHVGYAGNTFIAGNTTIGHNGTYAVYGLGNRTNNSETSISAQFIFYPANKTDASTTFGGIGMFRLNGDNYYLRPGDGYIYAGTYRLTFTW